MSDAPLRNRWLQVTEAYPFLASLIALAGIAWIVALLLVPVTGFGHPRGRGAIVETLAAITHSDKLADWAFNLRETYHRIVPFAVRDWAGNIYGKVTLYLLLPFLWMLEYLFPVKKSQRILSTALLQDVVWFLALVPTNILLVGALLNFFSGQFHQHLAFLQIQSAKTWPLYMQTSVALFLGEFLAWSNHYLRHKIRPLWAFHAVHHSQRHLNVITDERGHLVDRLAMELLILFPLLVFDVANLYAVSVIYFIRSIHNRFIHANIKVNLGWLGWVIASPQFHRVHHSIEPQHADTNFGAMLSVFDYAFGTAYPSRDVYPESGINDPHFPLEGGQSIWRLPANWFRQTLYPFTQLLQAFRDR